MARRLAGAVLVSAVVVWVVGVVDVEDFADEFGDAVLGADGELEEQVGTGCGRFHSGPPVVVIGRGGKQPEGRSEQLRPSGTLAIPPKRGGLRYAASAPLASAMKCS